MELFHTIFYQPIFNGLVAMYRHLPGHDLGVAIIVMTIAIRIVLILPSIAQIRSSLSLQKLQPKLRALQQKHKNDRPELAKQTMALYREHKTNPLSSCLPTLIQLPFLIALYQVFIGGIQTDPTTQLLLAERQADLYSPLRDFFATTPIDTRSFGFLDLAAKKNVFLALIVGVTQYVQVKMLAPKTTPPAVGGAKDEQLATSMTRQMNIVMPVVTAWISYILPAGLALYFLVSNLFSIVQQWLMQRTKAPPREQPTP